MRYVGVDPSLTSTGVAIVDPGEETVVMHTIKTNAKETIFERQSKACAELCGMLQRHDVICFEEFGVSSRMAPSGRFVERIEMCGMLKLLSPKVTKLSWLVASPGILKAFVTCKASAKKEEVMGAVRRWGYEPKNQDEADAAGMAMLLATCFGYTPDIPKLQYKQMKTVDKLLAYGDNAQAISRIRFLTGSAPDRSGIACSDNEAFLVS